MNHARGHFGLIDADDYQLDQPVVDQDAMADLHFLRQRGERRRDFADVAEARLGGDGEGLPALQEDHAIDVADAKLRPLDVADDRHVAAQLRGHVADGGHDAFVIFMFSVGEIESKGIDSGGQQAMDHLFAAARGAEGCQDLRAAHNFVESINESAGTDSDRTAVRAAWRLFTKQQIDPHARIEGNAPYAKPLLRTIASVA